MIKFSRIDHWYYTLKIGGFYEERMLFKFKRIFVVKSSVYIEQRNIKSSWITIYLINK